MNYAQKLKIIKSKDFDFMENLVMRKEHTEPKFANRNAENHQKQIIIALCASQMCGQQLKR